LSFSLSYFLVDRKEEKKTDSINSWEWQQQRKYPIEHIHVL
jgi:hypothetical protein